LNELPGCRIIALSQASWFKHGAGLIFLIAYQDTYARGKTGDKVWGKGVVLDRHSLEIDSQIIHLILSM